MLDCLIVADDLTGACDAAVQFAAAGLPTSVLLTDDDPPRDVRVAAVNTNSRNQPADRVAGMMEPIAARFEAKCVFKKIDSVLRGNPAAEIAAARHAFHCEEVIATPAYPAMGRLVNGDNRDHVRERLGVDTPEVSADADLDAIVAAGLARPHRVLWAGSAGLAGALARKWGGIAGGPVPPPKGPITFCIGSDHAVSLEQIERLKRARPESILPGLPLPPEFPPPPVLLLSGGDTAGYICRVAGVRRIDLCGEILPGIPWGFLRCGRFDGVPVVTKSGGFGAPDALIRIAEFFE